MGEIDKNRFGVRTALKLLFDTYCCVINVTSVSSKIKLESKGKTKAQELIKIFVILDLISSHGS